MPPPWEAWFALNPAQPPVLTRSQFRLCLVIQREFIGSLIRDWGEAFRVTFQFALPRSDRVRVLPLWDILLFSLSSTSSEYLGRKKTGVASFVGAAANSRTDGFKPREFSLQ